MTHARTHTPGPYWMGEKTEDGYAILANDIPLPGETGVIGDVYLEANARFIVTATNNHDNLLNALRCLVQSAKLFSAHSQWVAADIALAQAAIARAEGKETRR